MAKITGWSIFDGFRLRRVLRPYLLRVLRRPSHETVADASSEQYARAAELASLEHPSDWLIFYVLGSKRLELNRLSASLEVAKKCVDLRPNDIRSTYSLATTYNALSYAAWSDEELMAIRSQGGTDFGLAISKMREAARTDLEKLGLTAREAASKAVEWFQRCLELRPDAWSRAQIEEHLKTLAWKFSEDV